METDTLTLTGLDTLRWLADRGARFCKVYAWNEKKSEYVTDPGKQPIGKGWQNNPFDFDQAKGHIQSGGNVGLLPGKHSGDETAGYIYLFDADEDYSGFIAAFPPLQNAPTIVRDGVDRGKIIVRGIGPILDGKKFRRKATDKHPFFEFLGAGNQGVIAGKHPDTGGDYRLINAEFGIPIFTAAGLNAICEQWTGQSLKEYEQAEQQQRQAQSEATRQNGGDGLFDRVLAAWPTTKIFEHFNRAGEIRKKGEELKLGGNGGLYVNGDKWYCFSAELGGGPFQAWQYCLDGTVNVPTGRGFYDLLKEMAGEAGIPIPTSDYRQPSTLDSEPPEEPPATFPDLPTVQPRRTRWTAAELAAEHFAEPKWAVPDLIPVGLTFLAGRPKVGKSWLALQIALAVGTGGRVFDKPVEQGNVFYLALEDNGRRLQERSNTQRGDLQRATITFETRFKSLGAGGLNELYAELQVHDYRLVIIDTLSRAVGGADQKDEAVMTSILGALQQIALTRDIAILMIDHHRKSNGFESDPIDDIWNSTAKAAVADAAIGLYRERGKRGEGLLKIIGRDIESQELALKWDGELCCWQCLGNADQVREDTNLGKVYQALLDLAKDGKLPTTERTADFLELKKSNVSELLNQLVTRGQAIRGERVGHEVPYFPLVNGLPFKGEAV